MIYIKLYEAFFDKTDSLFEIISSEELCEFDNKHIREVFTDSEVIAINSIFNCELVDDYKDSGETSGQFCGCLSANKTTNRKIANNFAFRSSPLHVFKYRDNWFIILFDRVDGNSFSLILFDGIDGMKNYM